MFDSTFSEYYRALVQCHRHEGMQRIYGLASMALVTAAVAARDEEGIPVVALDVAGAERGHPAANHQAAYHYAQRHFLNTTCHAGEAYGPESIYQAITLLHAERIGHGYHIFSEKMVSAKNKDKAKQLTDNIIQYVAERRITLEVCLSSNLGTMPGLKIQDHHLGRMLQHRLSVALCTDNRLVSDTSIVKELKLAINTFGITLKQLRDIVITGFKRSFFSKSYREKRSYVRCAMNYFDFICSKHGLELPRHCYVAPPASPSVGDIPSVISPNPSVTITNESSQVSATVYKPSALYQTTTHVNSDKSAFVSPTKKSTE